MTQPDRDDAPFDKADPTRPAKAPRPRDAATLILVRKVRGERVVLMGQRARGHVFMPDKWVFPGGAVDRSDAAAIAATELRPEVDAKLRLERSRRAPRAFALAAVRETFEETGLVVGRAGAPGGKPPPGWAEFAYDGRVCLTANTRSNNLSIISVRDRAEIARVPVGTGPKHITVVRIPESVLSARR